MSSSTRLVRGVITRSFATAAVRLVLLAPGAAVEAETDFRRGILEGEGREGRGAVIAPPVAAAVVEERRRLGGIVRLVRRSLRTRFWRGGRVCNNINTRWRWLCLLEFAGLANWAQKNRGATRTQIQFCKRERFTLLKIASMDYLD